MNSHKNLNKALMTSLIFLSFLLTNPPFVSAECTCENQAEPSTIADKLKALKFKLVAILSILLASSIGVCFPLIGKKIPVLHPDNNLFFLIKAFAAGVILSTGFVHILPDAYDSLTSPCLSETPWRDFPFTGLVAMTSAIITMMVDAFATSFYKRSHFNKALPINYGYDDEMRGEHEGHVHVHTHATHGHAHGSAFVSGDDDDRHQHHHQNHSGPFDHFRHRVVSQVLEIGIVVHSVIIGISLGASQSAKTIKPLVAALTFHQFFEGLGLGGCISQAKFRSRAIAIMVLFFSLTTPLGIGIGIGISNTYDENSPSALIIEGVFDSASAGILIYMALVDFLAADFMNPKLQSNLKLQLGANLSLFLGAGCMSLLAKWA